MSTPLSNRDVEGLPGADADAEAYYGNHRTAHVCNARAPKPRPNYQKIGAEAFAIVFVSIAGAIILGGLLWVAVRIWEHV